MKMYTLNREQRIARPLNDVFAFFERPENLATITPPWLSFRIITPGPIEMAPGAVIDYTVRAFGIRHRWTTLIAVYDPPYRFIDVQLRGPYSFWHHTHTFEEIPGGTMIRDEVRYILPFGIVGRMAHGAVVKRRLKRIFDYRLRVVANMLADKAGGIENAPMGSE